MQIKHVAIIGGGFSGALQAVNLLRHEGPRATLIERRRTTARGVAYSAAHPDHLLNVRAGNMSALSDDPGHFARWLAEHHPELGAGFAPRLIYGEYLSGILEKTREADLARLSLLRDEAVDVNVRGDAVEVVLASGGRIGADAAILAVGNLPPHIPPGIDPQALGPDRFAHDPWATSWEEGLGPDDTVVVIGSGLTTIDIVLALDARGYQGRIVALSRRGLTPRIHDDVKLPPPLHDRPKPEAVGLLRHVRGRAKAIGWREAVDELRPFTQDLWVGAEAEQRNRFLRHLRPWWDIHRHRMAPSIAARIVALQAEGRLHILAGKLIGSEAAGEGVRVTYRPRGEDAPVTLAARRIINATGPQGDLRRSADPLLARLLERGLIRPDPMRIGIDVTAQSEVIGADGQPQSRLFALGPMTRGTFWEIVAVPDIRRQTWSVARKLSNAHWVGGEGL
ncbi:putative NAD(P)/FAD-binding protein YdhS [Sphingomonas vulcanisoli]|uniref:NAD(P)/FAD-binding protein YdhS n=1 Tax=Sphingomonas vulcanisoli TaxID=1658060 RepID=A0ABX0TZG0_9SPHN|nr:FAD/NAD(P)-binding protein [Sphingomonas vulcanisoli]NIJ09604.1 putative NAD(P)/FAD-binding protein YdhS [Sphingomonas vulcanisoli]